MKARLLSVLLAAQGLSGCYVTRMALHHNDLFNTRRAVAEVRDDPETPPQTRARLEYVEKVLTYATAAGLQTKGAYTYYIQTKEPVVSYIVQASQPDRLEFVTWWFPVVGSVPYLGFFKKDERDAKAAALSKEGYDINLGGVGAFSSLGWFDDPIFSSMLNRSEADLAHLFFHELTHRTLWVPGTVEFNENLAEYVASRLTRDFLFANGQADLVPNYEAKLHDKLLFRGWLKDLKAQLSTMYTLNKAHPREQLIADKMAIIQSFLKPPRRPPFTVVDYVANEEWNNASILGAALYAPDLERFAAAHRCVGDMRIQPFLAALTRATENLSSGKSSDPAFAALDGLCILAR